MADSTALVVAAHGSHHDPDAARPAFAHVDRIREREGFAEVRAAFWKEEPAFREVLRTLESDTVYVVPLFMAEGYFVDTVLPREFRVRESDALDVEKTVEATPPVGTHPTMREVIVHRAETVTGETQIGPGTGLAVVGHGTDRHPRSAASTRNHVERLRELDRFGAVEALFLDEAPRITDLTEQVDTPRIVVVPMFVADGMHTKHDIPRAIGLDPASFDAAGIRGRVDGREIRYSPAIGTDARMADVILERVADAEGAVAGAGTGATAK